VIPPLAVHSFAATPHIGAGNIGLIVTQQGFGRRPQSQRGEFFAWVRFGMQGEMRYARSDSALRLGRRIGPESASRLIAHFQYSVTA